MNVNMVTCYFIVIQKNYWYNIYIANRMHKKFYYMKKKVYHNVIKFDFFGLHKVLESK